MRSARSGWPSTLPTSCATTRAVLANVSVHVGSIGDNRIGSWYAYPASKAAQNMSTCNLARELGHRALPRVGRPADPVMAIGSSASTAGDDPGLLTRHPFA